MIKITKKRFTPTAGVGYRVTGKSIPSQRKEAHLCLTTEAIDSANGRSIPNQPSLPLFERFLSLEDLALLIR
jgi:hypothetical protein